MIQKGDSLPQVAKLVDQTRIEQYANASGDFNPIHLDHEFAAETQFGGTIAHGMMVAAMISEVMTGAFGVQWNRTGKMKMRFRSPVKPGQTVSAQGSVQRVAPSGDFNRIVCSVSVVTDEGEVAISGRAEVMVATE
jgi:3-hydroxybutyryl-CoA dehydratase